MSLYDRLQVIPRLIGAQGLTPMDRHVCMTGHSSFTAHLWPGNAELPAHFNHLSIH
jgi:hypothetical protein